MSGPTSCCEQSVALGEPNIASALTSVEHWLLIQVDEGWAPITADASPLQGAVIAHIKAGLERFGPARLQLIRRPGTSSSGPVVMAVRCGADGGVIYRLDLPDLAALLTVDIPELFAGGAGSTIVDGPLFLVCTHGVRDRCCSRLGMPVYQSLAEACPEQCWQTTHLGGHRFAATLVVLPMGLQFGRVQPDEVTALVDGLSRGEIYRLDRFRGRVWCGRLSQVGEAHIRAMKDLRSVAAVVCAPGKDGVACTVEGEPLALRISSQPHGSGRPYSCGSTQTMHPQVYGFSSSD